MVSLALEWSVRGKKEMFRIVRFYTDRNGNAIYSKKLFDNILRRLERIRTNPEFGEKTGHGNHRFVCVDSFRIVYRRKGNTIVVVAVEDARRDPEKLRF